jgi:hypothetical protein
MRASPAFQVSIERVGVWRLGVGVLLAAAAASFVAWAVAMTDRPRWLPMLLGGAACLAAVAAAATLLRFAPTRLRWDLECWHLGPASPPGAPAARGQVEVALDLGSWMLLRFVHEAPAGRRRVSWLPLQRRGLEGEWHALRCAVYCARPAEGPAAGPRPAMSPESQE